jgi:probable HAF family extracellular repeat protein
MRPTEMEENMKSILTSIAAGSLLAAFAIAQPPRYAVTDLGAVGGTPGQPYFVANNGLTSGAAAMPDGTMHAVLWYRGWRADIGTPGLGGLNNLVYSVNERGQAAGQAETSTTDPKGEDFCGFKTSGLPSHGTTCVPVVWQNNVMTPLPTLQKGNNGEASWINNRGVVAGTAENATPDSTCPAEGPQVFQFKPVTWENGKIQELATSGLDPDGYAFAINDNGQVVGGSGDCAAYANGAYLFSRHALLWQKGTVTDLGNLGGTVPMAGTTAIQINNQGQVTGTSDVDMSGSPTFHGFLWSQATGMQDLGTLPNDAASVAIGINDGGDVVGISFDAEFNPRAFLRQNGVMADLNALIAGGSTLFLMDACSINSRGEIVGSALTSTGEVHGYLATPSNGAAASKNILPESHGVTSPRVLSEDVRKLLLRRLGIRGR